LSVWGRARPIWARWHLGPLWSANVTKKEGHRLIVARPYAVVRHPLSTGVIAALWATAVAPSRWEAILGAAILTISFTMKARLEEKFLRLELVPSMTSMPQMCRC
jgi:protein-S-isoprenylcysteine O-methyltransferase Ste14